MSFPKSRQRQLIELLSRIAEHPDQPGDYSTRDDQQREVHHLKLGGWVISYWVDHPVREIRVADVAKL